MRIAAILLKNPPESLVPFAEACLRFSPQICLQRSGTLFIEIGKCRTLYSEETFLARLDILLKRFELTAKIALGDTLPEALIKANHGTANPEILGTHAFHDYLNPYGATDSESFKRVEKIIQNLRQLGILTVAEFLKIPAAGLPSRFGSLGLLLRARILGELEPGWPAWVAEEKIHEHICFPQGDGVTDLEPLLFVLKSALQRAFSRLWGRGLSASSIRLSLNLEKFSTIKDSLREWNFEFIFPQTSVRGTLPIFQERLERDLAKAPLESPLTELFLEISQTTRDERGQKNLYHSHEEDQEAFYAVFCQLTESLGKDKVFHAHIHEDSVPERSWSRNHAPQKQPPILEDYIPLRPTRILKVPERVDIFQDLIFIRTRKYRITRSSRVEKIAAGWSYDEIKRDYYRLELAGKPSIWVFSTADGQYFLHGYFE